MSDDAQWFESLGQCSGCNKPATGKLKGTQNQNMGSYCQKCADKRIAAARKERAVKGRYTA